MRWWRIRPASHIPEAEMMTFGSGCSFIIFESSLVRVVIRLLKVIGFIPFDISSSAFLSFQSYLFLVKTFVDSMARGLSIYTLKPSNSGKRLRSFISRIKYRSS